MPKTTRTKQPDLNKLKNLPAKLRKKRRFINGLVNKEKLGGKIREAKTPVAPNKYLISVIEKENYLSFEKAVAAARDDENLLVGFVLRFSKKFPLVGVDLDFDPKNKKLLKIAQNLATSTGSYSERSLNGGIHIFGLYASNERLGRKGTLNTKHGKIKFEIYNNSRYLACTGRRIKGAGNGIGEIRSLVDSLLKRLKEPDTTADASAGTSDTAATAASALAAEKSPPLTDDEVVQKISAGSQALSFTLLHERGELKEYNGDHSAAVLAWHNLIAFYTQDYKQVTRLFRASALNFGKWKTEPNRPGGKWKRLGKAQHKKVVRGLRARYGVDAPKSKYVDLLQKLGTVRRDLFTGDLFVFHEGQWKNAFDDHINNHLRYLCQQRGKEWKLGEIVPALTIYMHSLKPRLLIDVEKWDGRDRLAEMASKLTPKNPSVTQDHLEDIIKAECGKMFSKLYNPYVQPRMLLFQGEQGIGKDVFIHTLFQALGPYFVSVVISKQMNEKDYAEVLCGAAVVWISEFDRAKEIGSARLKDMISKNFYDFRPAYGRVKRRFWCRATWVGSLNPDQMFIEAGANRRFIPIALEGGPGEAIKWDYDRSPEYSRQLLAQMQHLCETGYKASAETEAVFAEITKNSAPEDVTEMLLDAFDEALIEKMARDCVDFALYRYHDIALELSRISRNFQVPTTALLQIIKATGRQWRHKRAGRFYGLPAHCDMYSIPAKDKRQAFLKKLKQNSKAVEVVLDDLPKDDNLH